MAQSLWDRIRHSPDYGLAVVTFSLFNDFYLALVMIPLMPIFQDLLGISQLQVGLLFACKPIAEIAANPFVGSLSDRVGRKLPMVIGLFSLAGTTLLFAFARTYTLLIVSRILQGLASSASKTAGLALVADLFPDKAIRGRKMAIAIMGISVGVLAGPPLGGIFYELGGLRLPFLVGAALVVIDAIARLFLIEPKKASKHQSAMDDAASPLPEAADGTAPIIATAANSRSDADDSETITTTQTAVAVSSQPKKVAETDGAASEKVRWLALLGNVQIAALTTVLILGNSSIGMCEAVLPRFLKDRLGLSVLEIGLTYGGGTSVYLVLAPLLGRWGSQHRGRFRKLAVGGVAVMAVFLPFLTVVEHIGWVLFVWVGISGFGMTMIDASVTPETVNVVDAQFGGQAYGRALSIGQTGLALGFIIGPVVGGALQEATSFQTTFSCFAALMVVFIPALLWALLRHDDVTGDATAVVKQPLTATEVPAEIDRV